MRPRTPGGRPPLVEDRQRKGCVDDENSWSVEPRVDGRDSNEGAKQKPGAEQQDHRESQLRGDEPALEAAAAPADMPWGRIGKGLGTQLWCSAAG